MAITKVTFDKSAYEISDDITVAIGFKATKNASICTVYLTPLDNDGNIVSVMDTVTKKTYRVQWAVDVTKSIKASTSYTVTAKCPPMYETSQIVKDLLTAKYGAGYKFKLEVNLMTSTSTALADDFKYMTNPNLYSEILAPTIPSFSIVDDSVTTPKHFDKYGAYIATQTPLSFRPVYAGLLDGVAYSYTLEIADTIRLPNEQGNYDFVMPKSGQYAATFTVRDDRGHLVTAQTNTLTFLNYSAPSVSAFSAERIAQDVDYNWVTDDDGGYLWSDVTASVSQYPQGNPWVMRLYLQDRDGASSVYTIQTGNGVNDGDISIDNLKLVDSDGNLVDILKNKSYYVAVELEDWLGNKTERIESANAITAVGALFDVEESGVAVGMVVDGELPEDAASKKFQCAYPAHFYGGVNPIADNEALTFGSGVFFHGYITGGKTTININVPIKKDLINVKWVECTDLVANIANSGGYCLTAAYVASGTQYVRSGMTFTITVSKETNELYINMVNKAAMTANNNDNVQCRLESMTLVFHTTERSE